MQEIKVGEYVRTKEGIIDKVIIDYNGRCNNPKCDRKHVSCKNTYYCEEDIVNHSKNIIDLIEVRRLCEFRKSIRYKRRIYKNDRKNTQQKLVAK